MIRAGVQIAAHCIGDDMRGESMTTSLDRRTFTKALALGLAGSAVPALGAQKPRRLKVGHTGITWGFSPADAERAIGDASSLGFHGYESFGNILEAWESKGGLDTLLNAAKLPLRSAYCPVNLTDPAKRKAEIETLVRWGQLIKKCGGTVAVIGPNNVKRPGYVFAEHKANIVEALNEMGKALDRYRHCRRAAPAHRHLHRDAGGDLRGDGSGRYALHEVRPGRRPAAEGRRRIRSRSSRICCRHPPRSHEGLRRRPVLPRRPSARAGQGRYRRPSAICSRARATT